MHKKRENAVAIWRKKWEVDAASGTVTPLVGDNQNEALIVRWEAWELDMLSLFRG
jgi:hypothetical protein